MPALTFRELPDYLETINCSSVLILRQSPDERQPFDHDCVYVDEPFDASSFTFRIIVVESDRHQSELADLLGRLGCEVGYVDLKTTPDFAALQAVAKRGATARFE